MNDGLSLVSATYLGVAVNSTVVEFDATGHAVHPYATNADGTPLIITGTPGDALVVLQLPFGSFTGDQTPADIQVTLGVSSLADLGTPLTVSALAGFAFGRDALNNPASDAPLRGSAPTTLSIVPQIATLDVVYIGPEQETATGPSYPRSWQVEGHIAPGQTLTNFVLTDTLPDGVVYQGAHFLNGYAGTITQVGNKITATFASPVTGGGAVPAFQVDFYVTENLSADGTPPAQAPVLGVGTGSFRPLEDNATLSGSWQPTDGRDARVDVLIDPAAAEDIITAKSIAVQKSVHQVESGTVHPGNHLEWTLDGQVSNYFDVDHLVMTDTLGDGQHFDSAFGPRLVVSEGGSVIYSGAITHFTVARDAGTGKTTIVYDVSAELAAHGIDAALNGGTAAHPNPATAVITFRSVIEENWVGPVAGDDMVDQGDALTNGVIFAGQVAATHHPIADDSGAGVTIPVSSVAKSIYAINGDLTPDSHQVVSGDTITFRLTLNVPLTSAHQVVLTDYLPLPVLKLAEADGSDPAHISFSFVGGALATIPGLGQVKFGPADTFHNSGDTSVTPTISWDAAANSLVFNFGDVDAGYNGSTIDLLFSVKVTDAPFGDGLLLTNQVNSKETNSANAVSEDNAIVQFTLTEPKLELTKSVVAVSNADAVIADADGGAWSPAGITWKAAGSSGTGFTGTITSDKLAAQPLDADASKLDAGDTVRFAIVVQNLGRGLNGAFDVTVKDTLPTGMLAPSGGYNIHVTDGAGHVIATEAGGDLFGAGLRLVDPGALDGALDAYSATSGTNVLIITYDLVLAADTQPGADLLNTATITHYAALEGGIDRAPSTPAADLSDPAIVHTAVPEITKSVILTSAAETGSGKGNAALSDLAIGETVTYRIVVRLPEGSSHDVRIQDLLPASAGVLEYLSASYSAGASLSFSSPVLLADDSNGDGLKDRVTLTLGDVLNTANNSANGGDLVTIDIVARVKDVDANGAGQLLHNVATVSVTDGDQPGQTVVATASADAEVVRPDLVIDKSVVAAADAGDTVRYTITVTNRDSAFSAEAFDLVLTDALNHLGTNASFLAGSVHLSGTAAAAASVVTGNQTGDSQLQIDLTHLDPGQALTVTFDALVSAHIDSGTQVRNTATLTGTTLSGTDANEHSYSISDTASFTVPRPITVKTVVDTSSSDTGTGRFTSLTDLKIGETVTFDITVTLPEGDNPNFRIVDLLPDALATGAGGRLEFVSAVYVAGSSHVTTSGGAALAQPTITLSDSGTNGTSDKVVMSFGDLYNAADGVVNAGDTVTVRLTARVTDVPVNENGDTLVNTAYAEASNIANSANGSTASVEIVEPVLSLDKSAVLPDSTPDAGDVIAYTIKVTHAASSQLKAYDLLVRDLLPAGLELVANSLTTSAGTAVANGQAITISGADLALGGTLIIHYSAKVLDTVTAGTVLANTATVDYDNLSGDGGRAGLRSQDTETHTLIMQPGIVKTVASSTDELTTSAKYNTGVTDAALGETVTFRLTATLAEGTQHVVIKDTLPTGMTLIGAPVLETVGGHISGLSLVSATTSGRVTTMDFGTVVNTGDNVVDANDVFTVLVTARVTDTTLAAGTVLTNTARIDILKPNNTSASNASESEAVEIVRPVLTVDKATPVASHDGADVLSYSITIHHATASNGPAYNIHLDDLLPTGMVLVAGSLSSQGVGTVSEAGGNVGFSLGTLALGAADVVITYQAKLANNVVNGETLSNTAALTYDTQPAGSPVAAHLTAQDIETVTVSLVNSVAKVIDSTSLAATTGSNVAPGEQIVWRITATLAEGAQHIDLVDLLPTGLVYDSSSVISLGGITGASLAAGASGSYSAATGKVTFGFGDLVNPGNNAVNANDTIVVEVRAHVGDSPLNGALLTNGATLSASVPTNGYGVPVTGTPYQNAGATSSVTDVEATLGGTAFLDVNGDGLQHGTGEVGIAGVTVHLINAGGTEVASKQTDANGDYSFANLTPGSYSVTFDNKTGYNHTLANVGGAPQDANDSDADPVTGRTASVTLAAGDNDTSLDGGYYVPARIGDLVFEDKNANGRQDAGEAGIGGLTVALVGSNRTTITDASGAYHFDNLAPGSYAVSIAAPGWNVSPQDAAIATEATDSDLDATTHQTTSVTVKSGDDYALLDAGLWHTASIGDFVFLDRNHNGIQDSDDKGIAGLHVTLLNGDGTATGRTVTTDSTGHYLFDGLRPGSYKVQFEQPANTNVSPLHALNAGVADNAHDSDIVANLTTAAVTVTSGQALTSLDAGFWYPTELGDFVWEDMNGNGLQDAGEPGLVNVTVRLYNAGGELVATTQTNSLGYYDFLGFPPGVYGLKFDAPTGYVFTTRDAGGNTTLSDALDSDTAADGTIVNITSNGQDLSYDAGLYRPVTLAGDVWFDVNGDGIHDAGEKLLAGVPVRVLDAAGNVLGPNMVTDANGHYSFTLAPGSYRVGFAPLIGTEFTLQDRGGNEATDSDATPANGVSSWLAVLPSGSSDDRGDAGLVLKLGTPPDYTPGIHLGEGDNGFPGTPGPENVHGDGGNDALNGGAGNDILQGDDGNDTVNGQDGDDVLTGGNGDDNLQGQQGDDLIIGGNGNDTGEGGNGNDVLIGGAGNDNMQGESGDDFLFGGSGEDILTGNQGNDLVAGGAGNDRLSGADGDDIVIGGRDNGRAALRDGHVVDVTTGDFLEGNGGADAFVYQKGDGVDLVLDYNPADGDTLTIYGYSGAQLVERTQDGRIAIYLDTNEAIILNNSPFADLNAPLAGVNFVPSLAGAPGAILGDDAVIPILAKNWVSIFTGHGPIQIAEAFPTDPGPVAPSSLTNVTFTSFQQFSGANDSITLGSGNNWIEAGGGFDTVFVHQGFSRSDVTGLPDGSIKLVTPDGTDLLRGVEAIHFIDGTVQLSPESAAAEVTRLYQAALGRDADQGGLNYWIDQIEGGAPLQNLAGGFLFSPEFAARYGNPSNQDFVDLVYQNVLERPADAGGAAFWTAVLASGTSRSDMLIGFSESAEYKVKSQADHPDGIWDLDENAASVARLYYTVMARAPDAPGLDFWTQQLDSGALQLRDVAAGQIVAQEFQTRYGALSDTGFINALYVNTLGRNGDAGGVNFWLDTIAHGATRADVALGFSESAEHVALTAPFIMNEQPDHYGIVLV